jgi:hypothetical protein
MIGDPATASETKPAEDMNIQVAAPNLSELSPKTP